MEKRSWKNKFSPKGWLIVLIVLALSATAFGSYTTNQEINAPYYNDSSGTPVMDADNRSLENGPWWVQELRSNKYVTKESVSSHVQVKCKHSKHCNHYRADSETCNSNNNSFCGKWKEYEGVAVYLPQL